MSRLLIFSNVCAFLLVMQSGLLAVNPVKENVGNLDVYLCIGQSNMAGRATLTPELADTLHHVYLLNDQNIFEPAVNPLNRFSTIRKEISMQRLGPSYSFAKKMAQATVNPIGLVVNARGGSSINSWLKGADDGYYEEALVRVKAALKYGKLKAVIWHQGEADSNNPDKYKVQLISLVSDLRCDLNMPELPFILGQISQWGEWTKRPEGTKPFNDMLEAVPSFLRHSAVVSSKGLKPYKDETDPHFDTSSQLLLGERYAEAVLRLIKK
ncbi:protein of unknown function [Mariniphaga anaerophila]|uniref:Sialate O-acetylesterase domain-containing protein n=1 Tax=Mariniphaga anaerophila TaxID=1484053 RepID=A0A1M4Y467_9BACT|nr:sialate O-acetylesterase [Mariniphaga anaerophila]SHF00460.1 protein of unknown function [Mariniphaga anaerophila]